METAVMPTFDNTPRGTVVSIWGKAYIRGTDGVWRPLKLGEVVKPGDALLTEQNAIVQMSDGKLEPVALAPAADNVDRAITALEQGEREAAPAAGLGGGDGGDLQPGLRVDRIVESVTAADRITRLDGVSITSGIATRSDPAASGGPAGVTAPSSAIGAVEAGAAVNLGLGAPTGGGTLVVTVTQTPTIGLVVRADGTPVVSGSLLAPADLPGLVYLPPADYDGTAPVGNLQFMVSNGTSSASGGTQITLTAVNDAPLATAASASGAEDALIGVSLAGTDVDGSIAIVRVTTLPANGTLLLADGVTAVLANQVLSPAQAAGLLFRPAADFHGSADLSFTVTDNGGLVSSPATVSITVASVNDAPVAADDAVSTVGTVPVTFAVLANDSDVDGDTLVVTGASVGAAFGSVVVNADGSLGFTAAVGVSGPVLITYTIADPSGATDSATLTVNVAAAPTVTVDAPALTNDNTPAITGTTNLPPGSAVTLTVTDANGAVQTFSATVQAEGSYSASVPAPLAEGAYSVSAAVSVGAATASASDGGSVDTAAPTITVDAPALGGDTTPTISGSTDLPAGSTVTLTVTGANGAVQTFSATVQAGGGYSADVPAALVDGGYSVVALGIDAAGNTGSASDSGVIDTTPPALAVDAPALTNDSTPTITGSTDLPAGSTVTLTVTGSNGAVQTFTATVQPGGSYSADVPAALAEGSYTVSASASDAAGNTAVASDTGLLDLTPPLITVDAPALTNDSTPTLTGTTDLPAGSPVTLTVTGANGAVQTFSTTVQAGGSYSADVPAALVEGGYSVTASATDAAGNSASTSDSGMLDLTAPTITVDAPALGNDSTPTITGATNLPAGSSVTLTVTGANGAVQSFAATVLAGGTYSADVPAALAEGPYSVTATATDAAGNSANANDSGAIDLTAPVISVDAPALTNDSTPAISGSTDLPAGSTITLTVTGANGAVQTFTATVLAGGSYSASVPAALVEGSYSVSASGSDAAGNSASASDSGVLDLTAPTVTVDAPAPGNDSTPTITGTTDLPAGSVIQLVVTGANGAVQSFTATVQAGGTYSADVPAALAEGPYSVTATATDAAGNSANANDSGMLDLTAPTLSVDAPAITNDSTPTLTGATNLPVGATVTLTVTGANGAVQTFSATVQAGGVYSADVPSALAEGGYSVVATAADAAGNSATASDNGAIDLTPPLITVDAPALTNDTTPTITGSTDLPAGSIVTLGVVDGTGALQTFFAVVQPGGSYSADVPSALIAGGYGVGAGVTDAAGNSATATDTGVIDLTAPTLTVDAPALTNDSTPTITGTTDLPAGASVTLTVTGADGAVQYFAATVQPGGTYSADVPSALVEGGYTVMAGVTDGAGNSASANDSGAIDLTPPAASIAVDPVTADNIVNAGEAGGTITITGTVGGDVQPGDTVTLTVNGNSYSGAVLAGNTFAIAVAGSDVLADPDRRIDAAVTTTDAAGNSRTATAAHDYAVNTAPVAVADALSVGEDAAAGAGDVTPGSPGQDSDADGDTLSVTGVAVGALPSASGNVGSALAGSWGTLTLNADGSYSYVPSAAAQSLDAGQTVTDTFTYTIDDGRGGSATATLTISVAGADDPTTIAGTLTGSVQEDAVATASGALTATDPDVGSRDFVVQSGTPGSYGSFSIDAAGSWSYSLANAAANVQALAAGQSVTETFIVAADDGTTASITVTVSGSNDAPVVSSTAISAAEQGAAVALGLAVPSDVDAGAVLAITVAGLPAIGQIQLADGTPVVNGATLSAAQLAGLRYLPPADYDGVAPVGGFSYTVSDGVATASGGTSITLTAVNDAPTLTGLAGSITYTEAGTTGVTRTLIDTSVVFGDVDSPNLAGGSLTVRITNVVAGEDLLDVRSQGTADGQISVVGTDVRYNPVGAAGVVSIGTLSGGTGGAPLVISFNANATPAAVDALIQNVRYGNQSQQPTTTPRNISFTVVDGDGTANGGADTVSASVTVNVVRSNDAPSFAGLGGTRTYVENGTPVVLDSNATLNDPELGTGFVGSANNLGGAVLTLTRSGGANVQDQFSGGGTLSLAGGNVVLGGVTVGTYSPAALAAGTLAITFADGVTRTQANTVLQQIQYANASDAPPASVTIGYTLSDGNSGGQGNPATPRTATGSVTVNITPLNDAPVAGNASAGTSENTTLSASVPAATDADGTVAGYALVSGVGAGNGTLTFNVDGSYSFDPGSDFDSLAAGATRQVSFTYTATDNSGAVSAPATVTITVTGTDDLPVITSGSGAVTEDSAPTASGSLTATDADNPALAFVAGTQAGAYGSLVLDAAGAWSYTLGAAAQALAGGQVVSETFTVALNDGSAATVTVTVTGTDDAPVISTAVGSVTEDSSPSASGTLSATDADNPALAFVPGTQASAYGSLVLNAAGAWSYTLGAAAQSLAGGEVVTETFTVPLNDGSTTTVVITVTGTDDAPVISSGTGTVTEDSAPAASGTLTATDADNPTLAFVAGTQVGAYGSLVLNAAGAWTYSLGAAAQALDAGEVVTDAFTVALNDGSTTTVTLTVIGTNDGPVAVDDGSAGMPAITLDEDSGPSAPITVLSNDSDVDGDTLTVTAASSPNGTVTINPDQTLVFTPAANFNGPTTITYSIGDGHGGSASATVFVNVTAVNDAPVAADDALATAEDTPLTIAQATLIANDTDVDGHPLTVVAVYSPVNGTVALVGGDVVFTPAPNYSGPASFTYMVTDGFGAISTANVNITVGAVNDAPVAQAAAFTVAEDAAIVSGAVVATDADAGTVLSFALDGAAPAGLVFNSDGSYSFDPSAAAYQSLGVGQSQVLTIPYTVTDEAGASSSASLVVTVTGTNDAPVAAAASFAVTEDAAIVNGNVAASDVDANAVLGFALDGAAPAGLAFNADGSYSFDASNAAYQSLAAGQVQVLTVPYTVTDQHGASSSANLVITITGVNDAAVVTGVAAGSVTEDGTLLATGSLSATDVDSSAAFTAASVSGTYGNFSIDVAGQWTYTLRNGDANVQALTSSQQPTETFNVTTADGTVQQVTVTVNGSNEAPVATVTPASGAEDAAGIPLTLGGSDADGNVASFTITTVPANGTLLYGGAPVGLGAVIPASAGSATLSFVPAAHWNGSTSIGFMATDNEGASSPSVSQSISVSAVNDAPVAADDSASTAINTPLASIAVLANDGDVDGDALTVVSAALANPALGTVSINPDGTLAFDPALNVTGPVLVNYTIRDPSGATSSATLTVNVGTNTAPTGSDVTLTLAEDGSRAFAPADFGFADADAGQTLAAVRIDTLPGAGSLNLNGLPVAAGQVIPVGSLGDLVFTPAPNANGSAYASFTFSVQDNAGGFDATPNTVTLDVTPVNDAPVAAADSVTTNEDQPISIPLADLLANDSDIELDPLSVISVQGAVQGTVAIVGSNVVFTPNPDYHGPASFTYTVSDGQGGTSTATVAVTVNPVNDPAGIGGDDAGAVTEDLNVVAARLSDSGTLTVSDVDAGEAAFVAGAGTPVGTALGTMTIAANGVWTYDVANADVQYLGAGQTRTETFTVRSVDGTTHAVAVTISGTNDGPVAVGSGFSVAEDAAVVNGSVTATDVDAGATLSYALTGAAPAGLTFNADGSYSFDPSVAAYQSLGVGQSTVITVPFRATDDQGASSVADLVITVTGTNDGPVAAADSGAVVENATLTATAATGVLANDSDVDSGDSMAVSAVAFGATTGTVGSALAGSYGTLTLNADGSYSYSADRPAAEALTAGQVVTESFTYTMRDAAGATSTATVTFTVTGTNDVPTVTGPLTGAATEDTTLTSTGTLVVTDPDAGQSAFVVQSGSAGIYGSFSIDAAGAWTYTLNNAAANVQSLPAGATVTDTFTITTADGTTRTIVITVNGTNDGPVAIGSSFSVAEDASVVNGSVTATDIDSGAVLSYALTGAAPAGLTFNADGTYSFDPSAAAYQSLGVGQSTVLTIPFTATDAQGASSTANLVVTVTGTNDGPVAVADAGSVNEDATLTVGAAAGVLANDTDVDAGDTQAVSAVAFGATTGVVGSALAGTYGTLTLNADGSYSYTANTPAADALAAGQLVTESFTYTMRDAAGATSTANLTFTVTGTNDAPTITGPLAGSATEDTTLTSTGTLTIVDPDAGQSTWLVQSGTTGTYGSFSIDAAGAWTYTLDNAAANVQSLFAGASVTDSFTVTTADGTTRSVVITINGTNDGPVAVGSSFSVAEDAAVVNGVVTATDVDTGAVLSYALAGAAPAGLTFNADGTYSFDASAAPYQSLGVGQSTVLTIPFTAADAQGASSSANLVITVTGTNDGPVAAGDTGAVAENATLTVDAASGVLANDTDIDTGDTQTVSAVSFGASAGAVGAALDGTYGTLTLNADGSYSYAANRPAADALGAGQIVTESFSYTMQDASGATSTATITFTVTGTNDVPTITGPLAGAVTEDSALTTGGTLTIVDTDAGQSSFVAQSGAVGTYGSFSIDVAGAWSYTLNNAAANVQSLPAGASVTDSFTVTTADGTTRTIIVAVNGTNDGPVAVGSSFSVAEDAAVVNGAVTATDVDTGAVLSYALTGAAPAGLTFNADGTYSFDASAAPYQSLGVGQSTVLTIPFTATDAQGVSSSANLVITVTGTNDGPTAVADAGSVSENATLTVNAAGGVLSNDTDVDSGDTQAVSAVSFGATTGTVGSALAGTYGTLTLNADGSYSYSADRPAAEALTAGTVVTESFTYTMRDAAGATSSATITFTITGTNDVPSITGPLAGTVTEDSTLSASGTLSVSDPDAGQSAFVVQSGSAGIYGSFSIDAAGAWTYTLNNAAANVQSLPAGATVTDSFTVTTADGTTRSVVITVNGTNDGPVAIGSSFSVAEDASVVNGSVTATDIDSGAVLSYALTGAAPAGLTFNADGTYSFDPSVAPYQSLGVGQSTVLTIPFTATDVQGASSTANLVITVTGTNDGPTAVADTGAATENATLTTTAAAGVLANDSDVDSGDSMAVSAVAFGATTGTVGNALAGTYGTLTLNADGSYSYSADRPAADALTASQVVTESFTYTMRDAAGATSSATITFTVTGTNDAPTITGPLAGSVTEDGSLTSTGTLTVVDADAGQSGFVAQSGSVGTYGSFSINAAGVWSYALNNAAANVQSLPAGASVTDSFTVTTADGTTRTIIVTVNGTNDGPVAVNDGTALAPALTVAEDSGTSAPIAVLPNDIDIDGDPLTVTAASSPNGVVTINPDQTLSFTPAANFNGPTTINYTVSDGQGGTSTATVFVSVTAVNDLPVAGDASAGTGENTVLSASVPAATDVDGTIVGYALVASVGAGNGSLLFNPDGSYVFTPGTDFDSLAVGATRQVTFTYTATDDGGAISAPATVTITVTGSNDGPIASNASAGTSENTVLSTSVPAAADVDGTIASYTLVTGVGAGNGSLSFGSTGAYTFTPGTDFDNLAAGATRQVTFTYTATDNDGAVSAPATVTITVTGTNDGPVASNASAGTGENTVLNASVPAATDVDGTIASYALVGGLGAGNGSLTFNADGSYIFNPGADFDSLAAGATRQVSFTYTATDNNGAVSAPATVTITVTGTDDLPVISTGTGAVTEDSSPTANGTLTATDVDNPGLAFVAGTQTGTYGSLVLNAAGAWTYTLGAAAQALADGQVDTETFTVALNDGSTTTVVINVTGTNDGPVASNASAGTGENTVLNASVPAATDVDGTIVSYALATGVGAGNGSLSFNPDGSYVFNPGTDFDNLAVGATRQVTFTYTATDNNGAVSAPATVTITVTGSNDGPVASNASAGTTENVVLNASVPAATDVDGTIASYALVSGVGAGNGALSFNSSGAYTFTPGTDFDSLAPGATRQVTFTYTATDNSGAISAPATVTITVTGTNDLPMITSNGGGITAAVSIAENSTAVTTVVATDIDAGQTLSYSIVGGADAARFTIDASTGALAFASPPDFEAPTDANGDNVYVVQVQVSDGAGGTDLQTISVTVTNVNEVPTVGSAAVTATEDTTRVFAWADFAVSDDSALPSQSIQITSLPADGTLQFFNGTSWVAATVGQSIGQASIAAGNLRFVPDANESGTDGYGGGVGNMQADYARFGYTASDGVNTSAAATMRIDVTPVADATTISAAAATLPASTGLTRTRHNDLDNLNSSGAQTLANIEPAVEADSIAATDNITSVSSLTMGGLGSDDAYRVSGYIYLQAGQAYNFTGTYADTLTIELGGQRVVGHASDGSNSDIETISGTTFVPQVSGFYSLELITYNAGGSAGLVDVLLNGVPLSTATYNLYASNAPLVAAPNTVGSFVSLTDTGTGTNAAMSVAGYYQQRGGSAVQGQGVLLPVLSATYGDSADNSERHRITLDLGSAPVGTRVFVDANNDGAADDGRVFTVSAGNTQVIVFDEDNPSAAVGGSNWNLSAIRIDPPTTYTGSFTVNAVSSAQEVVGGSAVSTSTATQALTVTLVAAGNLAPDVVSTSASVSEEGLAGGLADSTGTVDTTNAATVSGTMSITDAVDGVADSISSVTLNAPTTALTSGGVAITWSGAGTDTLTGTAGGQTVATLTINTAGSYTFNLLGPIDHPVAGAEDVLSISFGVSASDGVNTGSGTLTIDVEDDAPGTVAPITNFMAGTDTNLMIVLDLSGSMNNASGIPGLTRLQAAIQSINTLLDRYDEFGAVAVRLVTFSDTATVRGASWMSIADAKALLATLSAIGATDYDDAIAAAQTAFDTTTGRLSAAQNVSYFFSDGAPTFGDDIGAAEEAAWQNFLNANLIRSFAIGMGTGVSQTPMNPIAFNGQSNENTNAVVVAAFDDLDSVLAGTIQTPPAGALSGGSNFATDGIMGGDGGGMVVSLTIGSTTYTFDAGANSVTASGGPNNGSFDASTSTLTVTTSSGGSFAVDMDDGSYRYSAPDAVPTAFVETMAYIVADDDGDTTSSSVTVTVDRANTIIGTASSETLTGTAQADYIVGRDGDDILVGMGGNDVLQGNAGADNLSGGDGNDRLAGGAGNDALAGGLGADTFEWRLADRGTGGSPAIDTVADFDAATPGAGGDILDLRDLLQGETSSATLDRYLDFSVSGGNTTIRISSSGSFTGGTYASGSEDQRIVLTGVDIRASLGLSGSATDAQIISELINRGKLLTDVPAGS